MSTTSIRIPDELKARIGLAAERAGVTPHAYIVQALEAQTTAAEEEAAFQRLAAQRLADFQRTGKAVPWAEARQYLLDRLAGKDAKRPKAKVVVRRKPAPARAR